jgi:predicted DNA-binding ribbon-helix-helix protein
MRAMRLHPHRCECAVLETEIPTPARLEFLFFELSLDLIARPEDCASKVLLLEILESKNDVAAVVTVPPC